MTSSTTKLRMPIEPAVHLPDAVDVSYAHCKRVARRRARNFYYGMKLMSEPKRSAMYAIYAWMRAADDLADASHGEGIGGERVGAIDTFRQHTLQALDPAGGLPSDDTPHAPMWPAVRHTLLGYRVPADYLMAMIDGQLLDQRKTRYTSFAELDDYCYKVAGVVGLTCVTVWGHDGDEAAVRPLAIQRGAAFQLTNILRDLKEDAGRDRVYLPADELARFGYRDADEFKAAVLGSRRDARFDSLITFQVERAQGCYERSKPLEGHLSPPCLPTCWAMTEIYRRLLTTIAAHPGRVLTRRIRLSSFEKLSIAASATWRRKRGARNPL